MTGSAYSVYEVAAFVTHAKAALSTEVVPTLERVIRTVEENWTDDAGESLRAILLNGLANANRLQDTMEEVHDVIVDSAEALGDAQRNMGEAELVANDGGLLVRDGRIYPPTRIPSDIPVYDDGQHQDLLRDESLQEDFERKEAAYEEARTKVEAGCQALEGGLERLESLEARWEIPYFTLADITAGGFAYEAWSRGQQRQASSELYRGQGRVLRRQGDDVARSGNRHTNELQQMLDKWARDDTSRANDLSRSARSLGLLGKVLKAAGPVLAVGNVTYDMYVEGDPWQKAILSGGAGVTAGALIAGIVSAGWVGVAIVAAASFTSSEVSKFVYNELEPARFRLARNSGLNIGQSD